MLSTQCPDLHFRFTIFPQRCTQGKSFRMDRHQGLKLTIFSFQRLFHEFFISGVSCLIVVWLMGSYYSLPINQTIIRADL